MEDVWKIRLNITSKGRGKSGGARVIVRIRIVADELQLLYIYDKADFENVSDSYLRDILKLQEDGIRPSKIMTIRYNTGGILQCWKPQL